MNFLKLSLFLFLIFNLQVKAQNSSVDTLLQRRIREKEMATVQHSNFVPGTVLAKTTSGQPEQDCNSAIPVCQNTYNTSVSYSGVGNNDEIPSNSCLGSNEKNSVWYTFTTSSSGNLAFNITPNSSSDDYDFALYDITGSNCNGISNGAITPIRCNFSATSGVTGLSSSGSNASEPASGSNQSTVLSTSPGKTYVLVISNYSSSQSGYTLDFTPGTASIFDNIPPTPQSVTAPCGSNAITLNVSEQVKCSSIASNGSDFSVTGTGGPYTISSASGVNCGSNSGQVTINISPALSGSGPWTLDIHSGSDGNTLIDACGNAMAATTITFNTSPPAASISGPSSVCKGVVFALTANNGSSYSWSGSAVPAGQQNQQTISVTPNSAGTLNFTVTVGNGTCGNATATKAVTVTDAPIANFTALPSLTVCAGAPITFTNTSTYPCSTGGAGLNQCTCGSFLCQTTPNNGSFVTYLWTFGDGGTAFYLGGSPASAFSPTYTYNNPGTYNVSLTASGLINSCSNSKNINVVVLPAAPALTVSPSTTICPSSSATLTVAGGSSYTWTPSASLNSSSSATVIASPSVTTIYTVTAPGCSGSQSQTVSVSVNGTPPNIGTVQGPTSICSNATGMSYSVTNVAGATYSWTTPAGATITSGQGSNAISVDYGSTAGTVVVTASTSCGTSSASLVVNLSPNLTLSVSPNNPSICPGSTTTLTASGATNYTWSPSTNLSATSGSVVVANPNSTITYTVDGASGTCTGSTTVQVTVAGNLSINVTPASATICPSATTALIASGATNYTWSPASSLNNPNSASVTANPSSSTTYTIVGEDSGCTGSTTVQVVVSNNLGITASPSSSTICPLGSATLTVSGATNYTWSPSSSINNPNSSSVIANPSVSTTYTIDGENNGCTGSTTVQVIVSNSLVVTVSPVTATICPGGTVTLNASGGTSYTWSPSSGLSGTSGASVVANPSTASSYTVVGADAAGCFGSATVNINVANNLGVTATPSSTTICPGSNVTLSANGATTYTWSPATGLSSTSGSTVIANPTVNTTYTVVGASGACTGTTNVTVSIGNSPTITVNNATICSTQNTILSASGATSYTWSNGATTPTISVSPSTTDTYTVTGIVNGCTGYTISTVSVTPTPTLVLSHDTSIIYGNSVPLLAGGGNTYSWSPSSALSCNDCSNPTASPTITTQYCVISSNGNCYDTSCVVITVEKPCYSNAEYGAPNAFSPNGDGLNDEFCLSGWKDCVTDFYVGIYDRWGTKVFESTDAAFCWDGKYQGKDLDPAVFVYYIKAEIENVGSVTKKGNISLIR